jgi:hypothetical protein
MFSFKVELTCQHFKKKKSTYILKKLASFSKNVFHDFDSSLDLAKD